MGGLFVSFEGIDGCGKSTQVERVVAWMRDRGHEVLLVREPGGTPLGERVRELLLDPATGDIAGSAEALLYAASRAELMADVVLPALAHGRTVVADRFIDSSLAYQGVGRGLGIERVLAANELALAGRWPDLTVLLRVSPEVAARRRSAEGVGDDRIEAAGDDFVARVHRAYEQLAAASPERIGVVDGDADADTVHARIVTLLEPRLQAATVRGGSGQQVPT